VLRDEAAESAPDAPDTVAVPMTALDRRRVRRRLTAPDGVELKLAFATGTVLVPGSVLNKIEGVIYVVAAAPEDVAAVAPRSMTEAAKVAHAVGNLHRDFVEDRGVFLVLWDAPIELLLTRLGVLFSRQTRPFLGRSSWEHDS
jgi:urease accessory protein